MSGLHSLNRRPRAPRTLSGLLHVLQIGLLLVLAALPASAQNRASTRGSGASSAIDLESAEARVFLRALETIARHHATALPDSALWDRALEGLIEQLDDPYATVFTPAEYGRFQESSTGNYAGIGVQITQMGGRVTVTAVFRDTPAEGVGMLVGDRIVWVEGTDARDWNLDQARDSIRGEPGSTVNLRVERDGFDEPIALAIVRDNVHVEAVAATSLEGGVAYFRIDRIARGVADELEEALREHRNARSIVLDLRGNPGGYLDEALRVADMILSPGQKLASVDQRAPAGQVANQGWDARSPGRLVGTPVVVLVDSYTASASEIIAGALQDHDRAVVVGQRTFGKGVVQTHYELPAGRRIGITTGLWYTPLGRSINRDRFADGTLKPDPQGDAAPVVTAAGRAMPTAGGIFPDLEVVTRFADEELALLNNANEAEVPWAARMQEHAFELAKQALAAGAVERLPSSAFDDLAAGLIEAGMSAEIVNDPVARAYLDQQAQLHYLYRANAPAQRLLVQAERDRALAAALRLAREAVTTEELLAAVEAARGAQEAQETGTGTGVPLGAR